MVPVSLGRGGSGVTALSVTEFRYGLRDDAQLDRADGQPDPSEAQYQLLREHPCLYQLPAAFCLEGGRPQCRAAGSRRPAPSAQQYADEAQLGFAESVTGVGATVPTDVEPQHVEVVGAYVRGVALQVVADLP